MPDQIREAGTVVATPGDSGRMRVLCITEGRGSSGVYPRETLQEAADNRLIGAGTFAYLDHPSETENMDRPERSVRDLAGVFTTDAQWSDEHNGLVAEMQVFGPYRGLIGEMAPHIGMSIRGDGEIEMREGQRTVTHLAHIQSVDFVTRAGRGGKVLELLESARGAHRAVERGMSEATANDLRDWLQQALTTAYGGKDKYVWVRDFDDDNVWFELNTPDSDGTFQQSYTASDSGVELTGDSTAVRAQTTYVPVTPAAGTTTPTESQEDTMPNIEEARLGQLEEAAGRVPTLEAERDAAVQRATTAEQRAAVIEARDTARPGVAAKVGESKTLGARTQARVVEAVLRDLPVAEDGKVDEAKLAAAVEAAVKAAEDELAEYAQPVREAFGAFGSRQAAALASDVVSEADLDAYDKASARTFNRAVTGA